MAGELNKGHKMEEVLRFYFLKSGYYVLRGIPFKYKGFDVTDIDLWLYSRTSSVSREISIVDVKNKKTPQAIERIFWVKGLQKAVGATNALVATTDTRAAIREFGKDMNVFVLDGNFLNKINKLEEMLEARITEEELFNLIDSYTLSKLDGDWKKVLLEGKSLLASGLSFDSVNRLIENASFFAGHVLTKATQKELALRCFYLTCSFIAINIDFLQKELSFIGDNGLKLKSYSNGFKYGSRGETDIKQIIDMSLSFVEQYAENGKATANQARLNIDNQLKSIPANILAEYFSKNDVSRELFKTAVEFEHIGMSRVFKSHIESVTEVRSFIGVLLDFLAIDRVLFSKSTQL